MDPYCGSILFFKISLAPSGVSYGMTEEGLEGFVGLGETAEIGHKWG